MLQFSLLKKLTILFVLLAGIYYALPNALTKDQLANLPDSFSKSTINLGLDLQGGSHLVMAVDVEEVYKRGYENLEDVVRLTLRGKDAEKKYRYRMLRSTRDGVTFALPVVAEAEEVRKLLKSDVQGVEVSNEAGAFKLVYTEEEKVAMRNHALEQTLEILRSRVDEFGVSEPAIQRQGDTKVIVELPGIDDVDRAKSIIGRTAQLSFHLVDDSYDPYKYVGRRAPAGTVLMYETALGQGGQEIKIPYLLKKRASLTGENLSGANSGFDSTDGSPAIFIKFDGVGTRKFADLTTKNTGRRMAIVLDGVVYSAPNLREPILGGSAVISGNFTVREADDLSTVLRAGALPAPIKVVEERTIGPSLGLDSIEAGKMAIIYGFIAVMILMLLFYRGFGIAANVALLFNVVLIVAIMTVIGATLTLPGMAAIVLTIGMAVDANVLIFERIREETKAGRSPMNAMDSGFQSAFGTILDANITTLIVALVLFAMGSGPIKGFALTLAVGIGASMFTAIMVTRLLLVLWVYKARPKKLKV